MIKVERPGTGDDTRGWGPPFAGTESAHFLGVNRNKRSLTHGLRDAGVRIVQRLARRPTWSWTTSKWGPSTASA